MSAAPRSSSVPTVSSHVQLRFDSVRHRHVLLAPESVLVLNSTGAAVLELCDGKRTIAEIAGELRARYGSASEEEIQTFLGKLLEKRRVELSDE